ncbi:hypothetical protein L6452_02580 [Arctium lappa]|uniref:Uncharacterized protein n=1 Tax=Arctium lappa TaxID=4217 RepID=A0ACB9FL28_ARCLA|nr:hypothetical protein L6452_02580 [Arctium lappa]
MVGSSTGVKSQQGSRRGTYGWIESFAMEIPFMQQRDHPLSLSDMLNDPCPRSDYPTTWNTQHWPITQYQFYSMPARGEAKYSMKAIVPTTAKFYKTVLTRRSSGINVEVSVRGALKNFCFVEGSEDTTVDSEWSGLLWELELVELLVLPPSALLELSLLSS